MILVKLVLSILIGYLMIVSAWLALLTLASWFFRPKVVRGASPLKFLVVIPAHNEALQIGATVENIKGCDYPPELLDIAVIADNCTDATAETAAAGGAEVYERHNDQERGKGAALDWFLKSRRERLQDYGGIVFIDADSCPDQRMFRALCESLTHPEVEVVQGFSGVVNPYDSWRTALNSAAFNVFNHLRMAGNEKLFNTAILKGLGMAFSPALLVRHGWPANSVVEDLEFTVMLLEQNTRVNFNPEAVIKSEMAVHRQQADGQRRRWEGGRFALAAGMIPVLLKKVLQRKFQFLFILADLLIAPLAILVILSLLCVAAAALLMPGAIIFPVLASAMLLVYVMSGQLQRRAPLKLWLYLGTVPLYLVWKVMIYTRMLFSPKNTTWYRTPRKSEFK